MTHQQRVFLFYCQESAQSKNIFNGAISISRGIRTPVLAHDEITTRRNKVCFNPSCLAFHADRKIIITL